jgi:hypothetical protein
MAVTPFALASPCMKLHPRDRRLSSERRGPWSFQPDWAAFRAGRVSQCQFV